MKRARASVKKYVQRVKSASKTQETSASAAQETSIAANLIAEREFISRSALSSVGTSTAGDIAHGSSIVSKSTSHEQPTRAQSANPAATAEGTVRARIDRKIIESDNTDGPAEPSDFSNGLTADSGQTAKNHVTAPVNGAPVIAQAVAPVASPVTASNAPPFELAAPAEPSLLRHLLVQQSSGALIWHGVLRTFEKNDPRTYKILDKVFENVSTPKNDKVSSLFELSESKPESKALLLRAKAILPSLGTTRAVAMTIANVDPHKIAPFMVAGTFFIVDVSGLLPI